MHEQGVLQRIPFAARRLTMIAMAAVLSCLVGGGSTHAQDAAFDRAARVESLRARQVAALETARDAARRGGWLESGESAMLVGIDAHGIPIYLGTANANAAISTATDHVRGSAAFLNVIGTGWRVGVWDEGAVRATHQELAGRVTAHDSAPLVAHSTHVAGTIAATGIVGAGAGMAPGALVESFDWTLDETEMAQWAMATPFEPGKLAVSNHSYVRIAGWTFSSLSGNSGVHWRGVWGEREAQTFGQYELAAQTWDATCHAAPYYLPFKCSGNERSQDAPPAGTPFFYFDNGAWQSKAYDPATDPWSDGVDATGLDGYDCISTYGNAKNVITVGAITDAVSGGVRSVSSGTVTSFSSWGPADDGRVKPDVVANGNSLFSCTAGSDSSYTTMSGTSMSTPNACGSAVLLHELYSSVLPGQMMRASTLKALILHTADDKGNAGPDYVYGFGIMNTLAAAQHISAHATAPAEGRIIEDVLDANDPQRELYLQATGGVLCVTLAWNDPPGPVMTALDDPTPVLVNDLDVRLTHNATGLLYRPYVLDLNNRTAAAMVGDNIVDNVEQIRLSAPLAGDYTLTVSHKGALSGGSQIYSLITSGAVKPLGSPIAAVQIVGSGCGGPGTPSPGIASSLPVLGSILRVSGAGAPPSQFGVVGVSLGNAGLEPLPDGCTLYLDSSSAFVAGALATDAAGDWGASFLVPFQPSLAGFSFRCQAFVYGSTLPWGWAATPAAEATIGYQP
jgi:hypothetical protein